MDATHILAVVGYGLVWFGTGFIAGKWTVPAVVDRLRRHG